MKQLIRIIFISCITFLVYCTYSTSANVMAVEKTEVRLFTDSPTEKINVFESLNLEEVSYVIENGSKVYLIDVINNDGSIYFIEFSISENTDKEKLMNGYVYDVNVSITPEPNMLDELNKLDKDSLDMDVVNSEVKSESENGDSLESHEGLNDKQVEPDDKNKHFIRANKQDVENHSDVQSDQIEVLNTFELKEGQRGPEVEELKRNLNLLGFHVTMNYPDRFGPATTEAVMEFQKYYGLNPVGVANQPTLNKISEVLANSYREGQRNEAITQLKNNLNFLGFSVTMDYPDRYGPATTEAVKRFQKFYKLKQTGVADYKVIDQIESLLSQPMKEGLKRADVIELKNNLNILGFTVTMNYPDRFGPATTRAVKEFQTYYGLDSDGIAGPLTTSKLSEALANFYKEGEENEAIAQLKRDLNLLGFSVSMNYPGRYGPATTKAVEAFQRYYQLKVTGNADMVTLSKVEKALSSLLKEGQRSEEVIVLKENLNKLGFLVTMDYPDRYGPATTRAVKAFQKFYRINESGIVNDKTLSKINELLTTALQEGQSSKEIAKLKENLNKLGFAVTMDYPNRFGPATTRAVKAFQKANGIYDSGIANDVTLSLLNRLIEQQGKIRIFIDPGHGGRDPGASGNGLREKDITLDIARGIERHLMLYKDIEIKMSRTKDDHYELEDRVKMANDWNADYFVSVHVNSFTSSSANGFETFIHNGVRGTNDAKEKQRIIHEHIIDNINARDRGMKQANFHVLRETNMSAILLEYLFISNKQESDYLKKASNRDKLAQLTAEGIAKAFNLKRK